MADRHNGAASLRPRARPSDLDSGGTRPLARPEGLGRLPDETTEAATLRDAHSLDGPALIGLFHGPDGGRALLRLADGEIVRVGTGEEVAGGRVPAIGRDAVRLRQGDRELILRMPA